MTNAWGVELPVLGRGMEGGEAVGVKGMDGGGRGRGEKGGDVLPGCPSTPPDLSKW